MDVKNGIVTFLLFAASRRDALEPGMHNKKSCAMVVAESLRPSMQS